MRAETKTRTCHTPLTGRTPEGDLHPSLPSCTGRTTLKDGDEDYDYFVKHIADGDGEALDMFTSGNLKTPLSASGGAGIPILSGNLASPYANRTCSCSPMKV